MKRRAYVKSVWRERRTLCCGALACGLVLTCAPVRAHNCGPTFIGLKIGEGRLWQIHADLTEVETRYTIQVSPNPAVAEVLWDSPALESPFFAHHGDFGIRGVGEGQTILRVHWFYEPTGAQGVCEVLISVTPPFAPGDANLDGDVNGLDIQPFIDHYDAGNPLADLNEDGFFDDRDLVLMTQLLLLRPPDAECEIAQFDAPFDMTECSADPPFRVFFAMVADFENKCTCCEYRQYVRGAFRIDGRITDKPLANGKKLERLVFHEDGFAEMPDNANRFYGHRLEPFNNLGDQYDMPDVRLRGCNYIGIDEPKIGPGPAAPPNRTYSMDIHFIGEINDVCNDFAIKERRAWHVVCSGVRGANPDSLAAHLIDLVLDDTPVLLSVRLYDDDVLVVSANVAVEDGGLGVDSSEVSVVVGGFTPQTVPDEGALPETQLRGRTAHALYTYPFPPGSPTLLNVSVSLNGDEESLIVNLAQ